MTGLNKIWKDKYITTSKIPVRWPGEWFTEVLLVSSPQLARLVHGEDDHEEAPQCRW